MAAIKDNFNKAVVIVWFVVCIEIFLIQLTKLNNRINQIQGKMSRNIFNVLKYRINYHLELGTFYCLYSRNLPIRLCLSAYFTSIRRVYLLWPEYDALIKDENHQYYSHNNLNKAIHRNIITSYSSALIFIWLHISLERSKWKVVLIFIYVGFWLDLFA